jgi:hypothetical protein
VLDRHKGGSASTLAVSVLPGQGALQVQYPHLQLLGDVLVHQGMVVTSPPWDAANGGPCFAGDNHCFLTGWAND